MSHGPQHFESNNLQGKGCHIVCRITKQSTSRDPNRTRFLTVQDITRAKIQGDMKSFIAAVDVSKKCNLMKNEPN
jgi:hypothetical protein